jgi:acyl-CoA hydrolase
MGRSSISLHIEVRKYSLYSGEETLVCSTDTTFVRVDDDGSPTPIGETVRKRHTELLQEVD